MGYDHINSLIVILVFGSLILLAFVKITNPLNINKKGNRCIALFFMLYASFWLEEIAAYTGFGELDKLLLTIVHSFQVITAIVFYFSILYFSVPGFRLQTKHFYHLILPLVYASIRIYLYFSIETEEYLRLLLIIIILSISLIYAVVSYIKIRNHQKSVFIYAANTQGIQLKWLEYIIIQLIIVCVIVVLHNLFVSTTDINLLVNATQLITVFLIAYFSLKQKEIFPLQDEQTNDLQFISNDIRITKEKRKVVDDDELKKLKNELLELMKVQKPHLDSELNLVRLAELITITPHQLSYIINNGFNENFFQFVNRYRVERAKELLLGNDNPTMLAVAFDAGFNSKTSFNTTFKKLTQQTPTEFKNKPSNL